MAHNALVQVRVDPEIKEQAAAVLGGMGLTVSDAIRMLLTRIAVDERIPFEIGLPREAAREAAPAGLEEAAPPAYSVSPDITTYIGAGRGVFRTSKDVDDYIETERRQWD